MRTLLRCAGALALIMLAACGSGGPGGSADPSPTTMSDDQILSIGKEVAQCFRDNGVPAFPDPIVANGQLELPEGAEQQLEDQYSKQDLERVQQACQAVMDRLPESAIRGNGGGGNEGGDRRVPGPGDVDALRRWAECVRQNGIPEWPDPKADGTFPVMGTPLEHEGKSQRMINALQACGEHWSGGITFS